MDFIENKEEIEKQLDPEDVLRLIAYEKCSPKISGREVRDYCPIHKGSDQRSLAFNIDTKVGFCHTCGFKGDLIGLYQEATGVNFKQAIETLANHFGSPIKYKEYETRQMNKASLDEVWTRSTEKGNHRYLSHKKVDPCPGIRYGKDLMGNDSVVVPLYDVQGKMITAQFVHDKAKMFLAGHPAKGFFPIGTFKDGDTVYLAEGLATALTIWMALGKNKPVISFGSCGNMVDTVDSLKLKYPNLKIIICLDDNKAANDQARKVKPQYGCIFLRPSFELFSYPNKQDLADFNDIISKCGASLDVVRQQLTDNSNRVDPSKLAFEQESKHDNHSKKDDEPAAQAEGEESWQDGDFHNKLGVIINDNSFAKRFKTRNYKAFEDEHKKLFQSGGLVTGYREIDNQLYFAKGDLVIVQAMSNHGKSTFMLQLAYRFISEKENENKDPMCIFITYESTPVRIEEKLINIIAKELGDDPAIVYDNRNSAKYTYPVDGDSERTIARFDSLQQNNRIHILKTVSFEKIEALIDLYKQAYPTRTLILFLDYFQIIYTSTDLGEGWERIKKIAYDLEQLAIKKEIVIFSASQVNDNRQTREGKDIYNAATTVLDILNHSHASLNNTEKPSPEFKPKVNGKSVCTFTAIKQKHGESFKLPTYFHFNGYNFEEAKSNTVREVRY